MSKKNKVEEKDDFPALKKELGGEPILSAKEFLSTGSTLLDYAIANQKNGGFPIGRTSEIAGFEASGKSLLAFHLLAETQRRGGIAIYLDIERAADEAFMKRMGVDTDRLICPAPPKSIEDVFQYIENTIKVVRTRWPNKEKLVTVVWDSVAATQAKSTVELDYGSSSITPEARAMSACLKKAGDMLDLGYVTLICINQLREKIGGMPFADNKTTPHGKALAFYCSTRLRLASIGKIKETVGKKTNITGVNCKVNVMKNKVGPAHRDVTIPIMFNWGLDDEASWLPFLKECGVIKAGAWSILKLEGLPEQKFQAVSGFKELMQNPDVREAVLKVIDKEMTIVFTEKPTEFVIEDSITEDE